MGKQRCGMLATDVTMNFNMGFLDGHTERKMTAHEMKSKLVELRCHVIDVLPEPYVLGLEDKIKKIAFKTLEIGEWTDHGTEEGSQSPVSYAMKLTVSIQHKQPLAHDTAVEVINAIHDNGASFPFTLEEDANYFLYPFRFRTTGFWVTRHGGEH
jgi:prepilin-type processing-associated H-X9-DG protein